MSSQQVHEDNVLVLDFGSQYTQLIARRIREQDVYSEILPFNAPMDEIRAFAPKGIILSGGPSSVHDSGAPLPDKEIFSLGVPVLGICYGMQLMAHMLGGEVAGSRKREYGRAVLKVDDNADLLWGVLEDTQVWMSHGDRIENLPPGFHVIGHTDNAPLPCSFIRRWYTPRRASGY
jgi:GMP synthase (glutamine-hydrolysing)